MTDRSAVRAARFCELGCWLVLLALFAAFTAHMARMITPYLLDGHFAFNDFFSQWSAARFLRTHPADQLYDAAALQDYRLTLEPALRRSSPFPYPPLFLLFIAPMQALSYPVAYALWIGATLAVYLAVSLAGVTPRSAAGKLAVLLLAPVTVLTVSYGQNGFLSAALLLGGWRLVPRRPLLAGVAFGLLAFKPSLGVLLPVALAASGLWRTIAAAAVTVALLVLASGLTFGWSLWPDWLGSLPAHAAFIDTAVSNFRKPSVMAGFELFGLAPAWARAAQYGVGLGVVGVVWSCMARGPIPMAVAAMLVGTFAGSPYTFVYDMPVVSNAALLLAVMPARGVWRWVDLALVAAALSFPAVMILTTRFTWVAGPVLVLLFARLAWRALRSVSDPASPAPRL